MQRKPRNLAFDIKTGTVEELRTILNKLPNSCAKLQVWIGSDSGEGYTTLRSVLVDNARFCDLDGDEASGVAYSYFNDDPEEKRVTEDEIPAEYTFLQPGYDGCIEGYKDIVVLGDSFAKSNLAESKKSYKKSLKDEQKKQELVADADYQQYLQLKKSLEKRFGNLEE